MVHKMTDSKLNEHGLVNTGADLHTVDKQQHITSKKTALRDLQNNRNVVPNCLENQGPVIDADNLSAAKKPTCESSLSLSPNNNGLNGNLVYIRRKSEQELVKRNICDIKDNDPDCPKARQFSHKQQELPRRPSQLQGRRVSGCSVFAPIPVAPSETISTGGPSIPPTLGKPVNVSSSAELHCSVTSGVAPANSKKTDDQHFKQRFLQLQMFLSNYDNSNYEEYDQKLRSLSAADRNKHAVELEKRAIRLSLEESKEMQRMKALNIFGNSLSKNNDSPLSVQVPKERRFLMGDVQ